MRELDSLLDALNPVLERTRPLLADTRPLLRDAAPVVERLVPAAQGATEVLDNVRGSVLERVEGPLTEMVMSPWRGEGPYEGGGSSGNRFYEEIGYLASRASQAYGWYDNSGAFVRISLGAGGNSVGGFGKSAQQYLEMLGLSDSPGPGGADPDPPLPKTMSLPPNSNRSEITAAISEMAPTSDAATAARRASGSGRASDRDAALLRDGR
jgi:phospholipid/cholesterol/gamma-HCH transport system substrate-binding protein